MADPTNNKIASVTVRLTREQSDAVEELSRREREGRGVIVRRLLRQGLEVERRNAHEAA
jgi:hypothetical protein